MRISLCDIKTVRDCDGMRDGTGSFAHTSINCYVRYLSLSGEPGETIETFEDWAREDADDLPVIDGFAVVPVNDFTWTDDFSYHRVMTCRNHPENRFSSKNPWARSIFAFKGDCSCPISDLLVLVKN